MSREKKRKLSGADEQQQASSSSKKPRPWHLAQEVADSASDNLCPALQQLLSEHQPQTGFDCMRLIVHCLMVEAGFVAVDEVDGVQTAAVSHQHSLPSSVTQQLLLLNRQPPAAVYIAYTHRGLINIEGMKSRALLTVLNTGDAAVCSCAVVDAADSSAAAVCATGNFSIGRHVTMQGPGGGGGNSGVAQLRELRDLAVTFKDCIAHRAKAALYEACGLQRPPGLLELPPELLLRALRSCDPADLCRLSQVSRRLSFISSSNPVWRDPLRRQFGAAADGGIFQRTVSAELRGESVSFKEAFRAATVGGQRRHRSLDQGTCILL